MAKLKNDAVGAVDLLENLNDCSDFSFELEVLKVLVDAGFECQHGGSYSDPVTKKNRQFDIRATKRFDKRFLRLAVECKNLREHFPLLVTCVPRIPEESFHEVCVSVNPKKVQLEPCPDPYFPAMLPRSRGVRLTGEHTIYRSGEPVGKSCDQIGRSPNGEIIASDSDVYEKWSQALGSADDLTLFACADGENRTSTLAISLVFALLVVPNGRLWTTEYDATGKRTQDPQQVGHCSYFVNQSFRHRGAFSDDVLNVSHLDFVTVAGLTQFVNELTCDEATLARTFSHEQVANVLATKSDE